MFIHSEKVKPEPYLPINKATVNGSIATGVGFMQLAKLCALMNMPCKSSSTFILVQEFISLKIH